MFFILAIVGCFLLYGTSKYVPSTLTIVAEKIRLRKRQTKTLGCIALFISAFLAGLQFGWGTGLVIFLITLILAFCLVIILFPLNRKLAFVLAFICTLLIILENIL